MHELSLVADLLRKVESVARNNGRVEVVTVRLGALCHLSPEHLRRHFHEAARGTVAEEARLEIEVGDDMTEAGAQDLLLASVQLAVDR